MARNYKRDNIGRFAPTGGSGSNSGNSKNRQSLDKLKNAVQSHRNKVMASNGVEALMRKNGIIPNNERLYRRPGEPWSSEYPRRKK